MHIVIQDLSLVVCASHESLGLSSCTDNDSLIAFAFEGTIDHIILLTLCLNYTLVQIDVLYIHSLTIDYHIARNTLCCIAYYLLLIHETIHLGSNSHELGGAMPVVLTLEDGSR